MGSVNIDTGKIIPLLDGDLLIRGNHSVRAIFSRK